MRVSKIGCMLGQSLALLMLLGPATAGERSADKPKDTAKSDDPKAASKGQSLFDGKTLGKWKVIDKYDFSRHGKVYVEDGRMVISEGKPASGVRWTGPFPKIDYEVTLEGMRVAGDDFFCGLTFPVGKLPLTLVLGGWGGSVVGLSSIDGEPAVENETCRYVDFEQNRWYRIRLRVTQSKVEAWIDKEKVVDLQTKDRKFTIYWEMEPALPFGIATWYTTGALRNIRVCPITEKMSGERKD